VLGGGGGFSRPLSNVVSAQIFVAAKPSSTLGRGPGAWRLGQSKAEELRCRLILRLVLFPL